jgi:CheY-like chemotaxis protein
MLRRLLPETIAVAYEVRGAVPSVRADATALQQILLNLATNARDAMRDGGGDLRLVLTTVAADDITGVPVLAAARTGARRGGPQHFATLSVTDTGCGMSPDVMAQIFEPFFTTKPRGKGTGLGLALASSMIDHVGGEIRVESTEQVGTTFHLFLPRLCEAAAPRPLTLRVPEQLNGSETVLLVEDEDTVRTVATAALERRGYRVLAAAGGEAALAIARAFNGPIALLVTDVVMPGLNGRQLADRITQLRPGLPVLYVSGYTEDAVLLKGLGSDDLTLLPKPFTSLELARRVRAAIDATVPVA